MEESKKNDVKKINKINNEKNDDVKKENKTSTYVKDKNTKIKKDVLNSKDVNNKNQILNYDQKNDKKVEINKEIKKTVINNIAEKEKIKDEYKKIYNDNFNNTFNIYKEKKKKNKIIIILLIIIIFIMMFSMLFAIININNNAIIKGVKIMDIDVSGLTIDETKSLLNNKISILMKNNIDLVYKDQYNTSIIPEQLDVTFNIDDIVNQAFKIGRSGNIFQNNYAILNNLINSTDLKLDADLNTETLNNMMYNVSTQLPDCVVQSSYYIDGNNLIITNGKEGVIVNNEEVKKLILNNLYEQIKNNKNDKIDLPVQEKKPDPINIESIYKEIYKPAQDAYYTSDPIAVYPDVYGVDFAISLDDAKKMLETEQNEYKIPLKVVEPKVKIQDLGEKAFPTLLGTFRTNYDNSAYNRATNIMLAAQSINGTILLPGETFSYNRTVGDTTPEKGYTLGGTYINGKVVQSYGGGICQVSSTLYNAVVLANLDIKMRYNHSSVVGYVKIGRDATVSYGTKDFQFINSRKYPIKIVATAKNGVLKMEVYGIPEEQEYEVSIESEVLQTNPYSISYNYNSEMAKGKQKVTVKGVNGYKSITYKIKKLNGEVVSKEVLSKDTYNPMNRVIEIGTKE